MKHLNKSALTICLPAKLSVILTLSHRILVPACLHRCQSCKPEGVVNDDARQTWFDKTQSIQDTWIVFSQLVFFEEKKGKTLFKKFVSYLLQKIPHIFGL